jgi:hypothetical protein
MYDKPENIQLSRRERVLLDPLTASENSDSKNKEVNNYAESIAEDVNETIRLEYRLGGSFTEQEVETLANQALEEFDSSVISFSEVNELIDYNLICV